MFRDAVMSNVVPFLPISQFFFHVDFPSPVVERFADGLHWWVYLSFSPSHLASLLFSAICNSSSDNHLPFCIYFYFNLPPEKSVCRSRSNSENPAPWIIVLAINNPFTETGHFYSFIVFIVQHKMMRLLSNRNNTTLIQNQVWN